MRLLDHRILVVTGKGGVGKTTVCACLGLMAAAQGKRVLITETSGAQALPSLFGVQSKGYEPVVLAERLETLSITPLQAIEDYVVQQIRVRRLYTMVFKNRVMAPFVDAVPGLHDAVQLGKVWDCAEQARDASGKPRWDLVIVDAPATGHGLTMLEAPRSMMELTRRGPMFKGNQKVEAVLGDPAATRIVLVCLPEDMPVSETLDLQTRLGDRKDQLSLCVLNEIHPRPPITESEWAAARQSLEEEPDPALGEAISLVDQWQARVRRQDQARLRLSRGLGLPVTDMPFLFHRDLDPADLLRLSEAIAPLVASL